MSAPEHLTGIPVYESQLVPDGQLFRTPIGIYASIRKHLPGKHSQQDHARHALGVPGDVAVKRGKVGNVDTPRLHRRRKRLIDMLDNEVIPGGRLGFAMRAAELTVIENELQHRGEGIDRRTISKNFDPDQPRIPRGMPGADAVAVDHDRGDVVAMVIRGDFDG